MDTGRNPWDVLGVAETASFDDLRRAYFRRARATHPDAPGGCGEAFRQVQLAFETLKLRVPALDQRVRRPQPSPYDAWLRPPAVGRQWSDDDPTANFSGAAPSAEAPGPILLTSFADVLAAELANAA